MEYELDLIRQLHPFYWKNNIYFGIYIGCLVVLFLFRKREGWKSMYRSIFWYTIVALIAVCYNPIFTKLTFTTLFWYDMSTYVRVYLILPVFLTVAYVFTGLITKLPRIIGDLVFCGLVVVMVIFGETPKKHEMYYKAENPYKINTEAILVSDIIDSDLEEGERCFVSIPKKYDEVYGTDLVWQGMLQYDSNLVVDRSFPRMITEEDIESGEFKKSVDELEEKFQSADTPGYAENRPVYFVCLNQDYVLDALSSYGYRKVGATDMFTVMTLDKEGNG